jgi:hypothetical protein
MRRCVTPTSLSQAVAALQQQGFELVQDYPDLGFLVARTGQLASAIPLPGQPTAAVQATTAQRVSALSQAQGIVQVRKEFIMRKLGGGINKSFASQYSAGTCPGDRLPMLVAGLPIPHMPVPGALCTLPARSTSPACSAALNPLKPNTKQVTPYGVSYVGGDSVAVMKAAKACPACWLERAATLARKQCRMLAAAPHIVVGT